MEKKLNSIPDTYKFSHGEVGESTQMASYDNLISGAKVTFFCKSLFLR